MGKLKHGQIVRRKTDGQTMFIIDTKESGLVGVQLTGLSPEVDYDVIGDVDVIRFRFQAKDQRDKPPTIDIEYEDVWRHGVSEHGVDQMIYKEHEHLIHNKEKETTTKRKAGSKPDGCGGWE